MHRIKNFVQLTPDMGTSGQPIDDQFKLIADAGYHAVINLAMPNHPQAISNEGCIVTGLGMTYLHIPVPFDNPRPEHIRMFCKIMESLEGEKVWAHCIMNYRVTAFAYHYLSKVKKFNDSESMSPMFKEWEPDEVWKAILDLTANEIGL